MQYLLAVSKKYLPKEKYYWCAFKKTKINKKDKLLVYIKQIGLAQLYEVIDPQITPSQTQCEIRNMITIGIRHIYTFIKPLTYSEIVAHNELKTMGAVSRRFQLTTFTIDKMYWDIIVKLLKEKNPEFLDKYL